MTPAPSARQPLLADIVRPGGVALSAALRPAVPRLIEEMIEAIRAELPEYDRPLRGRFGDTLRLTTTGSIERFLALVDGEAVDESVPTELYVELGRNELRSGRPIDTLLSAYRIGARVMWRGFAAEGKAAGVDADILYRLAEALFAYVDELSHESSDGYAEERALRDGARERERDRLLEVLMRRPAADAVVVHAQALRGGWTLPERVAPVVAPAARLPARTIEHRLPHGSMAATLDGMTVALVPDLDGPGRAPELARGLDDVPAARGSEVPTLEVADEIEEAMLAAGLQQVGVLPGDCLITTSDHQVPLLLHRHPERARSLADAALKPLDGLPERTRQRLTETLAAWLDSACNTRATAQHLHVHVQTLRYRLRQLEQVFGCDRLASAEARLELQLGLTIRRARARPSYRRM